MAGSLGGIGLLLLTAWAQLALGGFVLTLGFIGAATVVLDCHYRRVCRRGLIFRRWVT